MQEQESRRAWLIVPAAAPHDSIWQGRDIYTLAVLAATPAFARLVADRWASDHNLLNVRRPGFEDESLYHVREAPAEPPLDFTNGAVLVVGEPLQSLGASNQRPSSLDSLNRQSPEGKTASTGVAGDVDDFPGAANPAPGR